MISFALSTWVQSLVLVGPLESWQKCGATLNCLTNTYIRIKEAARQSAISHVDVQFQPVSVLHHFHASAWSLHRVIYPACQARPGQSHDRLSDTMACMKFGASRRHTYELLWPASRLGGVLHTVVLYGGNDYCMLHCDCYNMLLYL